MLASAGAVTFGGSAMENDGADIEALASSGWALWPAQPHLVALVRAGARFERGVLIERPDQSGGDQQAA